MIWIRSALKMALIVLQSLLFTLVITPAFAFPAFTAPIGGQIIPASQSFRIQWNTDESFQGLCILDVYRAGEENPYLHIGLFSLLMLYI